MKSVLSRVVLLVALFSVLVIGPPGCTSEDEVRQAREEVVHKRQDLDAAKRDADAVAADLAPRLDSLAKDREDLSKRVAEVPAGTPERASAEAALASVIDRIGPIETALAGARKVATDAERASLELGKRIEAADELLAANADPSNPGSVIGSLVGSLVPGAAALAPILGAFGYRLARLSKAKAVLTRAIGEKSTAIEKIVGSIDVLAKIAPEVKAAIEKHASTLDAIQTPTVKAEVDAAQARFRAPVTAPVAPVV